MDPIAQTTRRWRAGTMACAAMCLLSAGRLAGQTSSASAPEGLPQASGLAAPGAGVVLDRVVAVVNGEVLLESDVDEERRFEEIQPYRAAADSTREKIIERLV